MQAYVNDLTEQNEVLVQTVEELEREANERVNILESKLKQVSGSTKVIYTWFMKVVILDVHVDVGKFGKSNVKLLERSFCFLAFHILLAILQILTIVNSL